MQLLESERQAGAERKIRSPEIWRAITSAATAW